MRCTGAFLAGIIVPRDGGLAISLTEKLEDMVSIIFLPLVSLSGFEVAVKLMIFSISRSLAFQPPLDC
jgi:Kef-type K+ transport system membrane component KefB